MPTASFEGQLLHHDIYEQASEYAFHICQNHPFINGNKRTSLAAALVFLDLNGIILKDPKEELYKLIMGVASGKRSKAEIAETLRRMDGKGRQVQSLLSETDLG